MSLPSKVDALKERAEENVVAYASNYARVVLAAIVLCALAWRPSSLVGLAGLALIAHASNAGWLGEGPSFAALAAAAAPAVDPNAPPAPAVPPPPPLRVFATLAAYALAAYTHAFVPVTRGGWWGVAVCAAHAALRAAPGELRAAASARSGAVPTAHSMLEVVRGRSNHPSGDPRRLVRELAAGAAALGRAAWLAARAGAAAGLDWGIVRLKGALHRPPRRLG